MRQWKYTRELLTSWPVQEGETKRQNIKETGE